MKPQIIYSGIKIAIIAVIAASFFVVYPFFYQVRATAGIYRTINFQGKLVNKTDGTNITDGAYNFTFKFYDAASSGNQLPTGTPWSETQSLTVTNGIFRATLGSSTSIPATLDFNSDSLYLDITFNSETFTTRVRMTSVPYAFNAEKVSGLTVSNTTGTLTIPNGKTIQFADAFTTSGAFPLTLTVSNTTNATIPSGTITLVDLGTGQTLTNKTIGSTGLVFSGAATDISTVNNEDFAIVPNGTGKVGIGTTTPGAKLDVNGNLNVVSYATVGASLNVGYASVPGGFGNAVFKGNVGIGTTLPSTIMQITGDSPQLFIQGITSGASQLAFSYSGNTSRGGIGYNDAQTDMLQFYTNGGLNSSTTRMSINANGQVAIGSTATNPGGVFNVTNNSSSNLPVLGQAAAIFDQYENQDIFTASSSGVSKFTVSNTGNATSSGNITMGGQLQVGRYGGDPATLGNGSVVYNTVTNKFRCYQNSAWTDCIGAGGTPVWSSITAPTTNLSMNMYQSVGTSFSTTFTYGNATSTTNLFNITDTTSNSGTGYLFNLTTASSSNLQPFHVSAAGTEAILVDKNGNVGIGNTSPTQKLDITGNATVSGDLTFANAAPHTIATRSFNNLNIGDSLTGNIQLTVGTGKTIQFFSTSNYIDSSGNLVFSGAAVLGANAASAGQVRLPNNTWIAARNAANSADINMIQINGSNLVNFGANLAAFTLGGAVSGNNQNISLIGNISANGSGNTITGFGTIGTTGTTAFNGSSTTLNGTGNVVTLSGAGANINFSGAGLAQIITAASQNLALMPGGNVGIGTTAPTAGFQVNMSGSYSGKDILFGVNSSSQDYFMTFNNLGYLQLNGSASQTYIQNYDNFGAVNVGVNSNTTSLTIGHSSINTVINGNVGIGDTSPLEKLDVNGNATIAGNLTLDSGARTIAGRVMNDLTFGDLQTGNLLFQPKGTAVSGRVQIGAGGTGSTTPDLLVLDSKSDAEGAFTGTNGAMYYNASSNTFRCYQNGAWTNCIGSGVGGGVSLAPSSADTATGANNAIFVNETGTGNLLKLQQNATDRFVVSNSGGLTVNGTDRNIVRTTTTQFNTGTLTNLDSSNDKLELQDGTVPNSGNGTITTGSQPTTSGAIGAGSFSITRANGKYLVIRGGGTGMDVYDSIAGTFSNSSQVLNGNAGAGAVALPRPDGRYRIIHGGGLTTTSLVDPNGVQAVGSSVAVNASNAGTVAYLRASNGRFLVTNGAAGTTQIYNPLTDAFVSGPAATSGTWAAGALVLPGPDNSALIIQGGSTATTQLYTTTNGAADIGSFVAGPSLPTGCEINGAGSIAIRKPNGTFIVASKINASAIYDPVANTWSQNSNSCTTPTAGKGPTVALADGAHAIPMQNGTYMIFIGGASTVTNIYDPSTDTFTAGTQTVTAGGAGRHSIMRYDGQWQLINGGGTGTNLLNTGLNMSGQYVSDDISSNDLNATSTLRWIAQYEAAYLGTNAATNTAFSTLQFFIRTATNSSGCTTPLNSASDKELRFSGDYIDPASGNNCIRITVKYNRPIPKRIYDERATWTGNNTTTHRMDYVTPTLFETMVDNATAFRRENFTLPNPVTDAPQNETSGPVLTRAEALSTGGVYLPYGRLIPQSISGTTGYYTGIASNAHAVLAQAQTRDGTIVIQRPNKTFKIIAAPNTLAANAALYDPSAQVFTSQSGSNIPTATNGPGGFAIKRPDGKFLVVLGNASATTNIYDPVADTFSAGPNLTGNAATGSAALINTDGTYTIVHGNALTTSTVYDPGRNTVQTGPTLTTAANCGFWAIPLVGQNMYRVFPGVGPGVAGVTTTMNYDNQAKVFSAGTALTTAHGCGSFVFQRQDGYWVSVTAGSGASGADTVTTNIINPFTSGGAAANSSLAGPALTGTAGTDGAARGAHVIPRADGTFLIIHGRGVTRTTIYSPWGSTFGIGAPIGFTSAGPTLPTAVGGGAVSFQRADGKWVLISGGQSNVVQWLDAGWYSDGQYMSEQINLPTGLAANSTIEWKRNADNHVRVEVRAAATQAALGTTGYTSVALPGNSFYNAGGETWVQFEVNFRRDFPSFCGTLSDVYVSDSGRSLCYRTVPLPSMYEIKINNGMDLMTLQSNNHNLFRVTSNGGVYVGAEGGFYTGGADLAERYTSTEVLEPGEVVVGDAATDHSVKRSTGQYQNTLLGVVSTQPGFVAGNYTEDSYPIALVGRVPVKVSTENGMIHTGDALTSSSIPGYAMKAIVAGRVVGRALEDLAEAKVTNCPAFGLGNLPETKCGTIMMFVNLVDYQGASVDVLMAQQKNIGVDTMTPVFGLTGENNTIISAFSPGEKDEQTLSFLNYLKIQRALLGGGNSSEILIDRINAIDQIVSPKIVTDILYAKKIKAQSIEGFDIYFNKLSKLDEQFATLSAQINTNEATQSAKPVSDDFFSKFDSLNSRMDFIEKNVLGVASTSGSIANTLGLNPSASIGADLKLDQNLFMFNNLTVLGRTNLFDLGVTGNFTVGLLTINGTDLSRDASNSASMYTLSGPLELQKHSLGNLEIMDGKVIIDTKGNLAVAETVTAKEIKTSKLTFIEDKTATGSGVLATSAGKVLIPVGKKEITVSTSLLTPDSLIFATPENLPTPVATRRVDDKTFEIKVDTNLSEDLKVNWWIVN